MLFGLFSKPAIGLNISDHSIEAVFIEKRRGVPTLVSYGRMILPAGIVVNGYVERREELSVMIRKLMADGMNPALPKKIHRVVFAFPDSRVFSHVFQVPRIADEKEIGETLAMEADAFFPYHHEELIPGYTVIDTKPDTKDIYYAAVHEETMRSYLALFHQANLEAIAAEPESAAIARALILPTERQPVVILDIGARTTDLSVFDARGIQFAESLDTAGDVFTRTVTDALNVPFEEAEELKKTNGLGSKRSPEAAEELKKAVDRLIGDARKAIAYYERRSGRKVSRVLLAGGSAMMPGMLERFSQKLVYEDREIRVQLGDPWLGMNADPVPEKMGVHRRGVVMATAIGLGLRGAKHKKFAEIDLLKEAQHLIAEISPGKAKKKKKKKDKGLAGLSPWVIGGLGFLLFIITSLGTWFLAYRFYVSPQEERGQGADLRAEPTAAAAFETMATLGDRFSPEQGMLKAVPVEVSASASREFESSSTAVPAVAEGEAEIINESGTAQPLVATTRLLSEDGVLFRLRNRVTVPANGSVRAEVYADQEGESGNIDPATFTIPGLSPSRQEVVYARSDVPMTGGIVYEGEPFTQAELDLAVSEIAAEAREDLPENAREKASEEFYVLSELLTETGIEILNAPAVGEPTSAAYTIEVRVNAVLEGVSRDEVERLAMETLAEEEGSPADWRVEDASIEVTEEEGNKRLRISGAGFPRE